jgi:hypothetical protein
MHCQHGCSGTSKPDAVIATAAAVAADAVAVASLVSTVAPGDDTYGCWGPKNSVLAAAAAGVE